MIVKIHLLAASVAWLLLLFVGSASAGPIEDEGAVKLDNIPNAVFKFDGVLGQRVKGNVENWLLVTPAKNPGMLDMFADREKNVEGDGDSHKLVPWAGEFVGKYLTSAVLAMRMSDDPRLRETVAKVVDRLIQLQTKDGYLGCWPTKEQLLGHWDLWGNYHVMLGLLLWYEQTGDEKAMTAACKIGDLVCNTFLDGKRRVVDAGSPEMNMGIIHGLALLYRKTGEPRYLRMAKEVLKDFEKAGDYYRQGLQGVEYFRTPRPRWESLHALLGLAELYRITGDQTLRRSFLHHWASIRRLDVHNTGVFSSDEQATGNPFNPKQSIETCCVVAWEAMLLDALRLSGDSTIADDLELATTNSIAGGQHPSGAWCTYDTPMNGRHVPSHVHISFQARPGAMFLNCCSVNGPRVFGMLSQWAVMRSGDGLAVNYYGPMRAKVTLADGTPVAIEEDTDYPVGGTIRLKILPQAERTFTLSLRIPAWSTKTDVSINGKPASDVRPGEYLKFNRSWQPGDEIVLRFDMGLRYESGDLAQAGKASIYRGPILLCSDSRFNKPIAPTIDVARLGEAKFVSGDEAAVAKAAGKNKPWVVVDLPTTAGTTVRLIDFANAGATTVEGATISEYASWLPAKSLRPPRPAALLPADGAKIGPGPMRFTWRRTISQPGETRQYELVIAESATFDRPILCVSGTSNGGILVPADQIRLLRQGTPYYWKLVANNQHGHVESTGPYKRFTIDPTAPQQVDRPDGFRPRDKMVTEAALRGDVKPTYGTLLKAKGWQAAAGPDGTSGQAILLDGKTGMVKYAIPQFPEDDFSVAVWVSISELPKGRMGQIFSAWACGNDDPLRLTVENGKLNARIEASNGCCQTPAVTIETGEWHHVAAVRQDCSLTLYVDGRARGTTHAPIVINSMAQNFAIGANPNYAGQSECLAAKMADLRFYGRALSAEELKQLYKPRPTTRATAAGRDGACLQTPLTVSR